jgi:hypothetical protein
MHIPPEGKNLVVQAFDRCPQVNCFTHALVKQQTGPLEGRVPLFAASATTKQENFLRR